MLHTADDALLLLFVGNTDTDPNNEWSESVIFGVEWDYDQNLSENPFVNIIVILCLAKWKTTNMREIQYSPH